MDPWQPCPANNPTSDDISSHTSNVVGLALRNGDTNEEVQDQNFTTSFSNPISDFGEDQNQPDSDNLTFGDNFQPFVKLSDSQQYLESLQRKLNSLQKGGSKGPSAESILRSLGQTKESCMIKLLSNSVEKLTVEGEIFEELKVNPLLKKLAPEKQALTAEELVHLLKADQLELLLTGKYNVQEDSSTETGSEKVVSSEEPEKDKDSTEETGESSETPQ